MCKFLPIVVLSLVACGGSSEETETLIRAIDELDAALAIDTFESFPGTLIHGEGNGPGGGDECGNIKEVNAYRTDDLLVFRIEDTDGLCFDTDIYEIILDRITYQGVRGSFLFFNNGDPAARVRGLAFFQDEQFAGTFVSDVEVFQRMDDPDDKYLYLTIPLSNFAFNKDDEGKAVFRVRAQIERLVSGDFEMIDETDWVNVDFVDPN
ncbi:MAG: hypothetical protein V3T86_09025 [Planctomycetota bacterium]